MIDLNVTLVIIIITVGVSYIAMKNRDVFVKLLYSPYQAFHRKEYYRLVTHALLHADWTHLFVNMWVLYIFGKLVESSFDYYNEASGKFLFILLYVGGIIFATLPALRKHRDDHMYSSVGASGAVAAILFASIAIRPTMSIYLMFIPIPIPAFIFGILYLVYEAYMDKKANDYVAHDAHYYGAIFGILFTFLTLPGTLGNFFSQIIGFF